MTDAICILAPAKEKTPLMRALIALETKAIAELIRVGDLAALIEICEIRDALVAGEGRLYGFDTAAAGQALRWLRKNGWLHLREASIREAMRRRKIF